MIFSIQLDEFLFLNSNFNSLANDHSPLNFYLVGGRKKNIPFRRQRMEIESVAPPVNITVASRPTLTSDPYIADLLKIADSKIAEMREEGRIHGEEKEGFEGRIKNLRTQVRLMFYIGPY